MKRFIATVMVLTLVAAPGSADDKAKTKAKSKTVKSKTVKSKTVKSKTVKKSKATSKTVKKSKTKKTSKSKSSASQIRFLQQASQLRRQRRSDKGRPDYGGLCSLRPNGPSYLVYA